MAIRRKSSAAAATVAKFYGDVAALERLWVQSIAWDNKTANAGNNILLEDEDGNNDFFRISLDIAGTQGQVRFDGPGDDDLGLQLPKGKDIKLTLSGGTANCFITITCRTRTSLQ